MSCCVKITLLILLFFLNTPSLCATVVFPLEPPDTSSPRATLNSFIHYTDEFYAVAVADEIDGALGREFLQRAEDCFDFSQVPPTLKEEVGIESVLMLREILDRIELPAMKDVPDIGEAAQKNLRRWRIPHTEITLGKVLEGPDAGAYLFTPETVKNLEGFYQEVRALPYREDRGKDYTGLYEQYIYSSGWLIPQGLLKTLPGWMHNGFHNQAIWQWIALLLLLGLSLTLIVMLGKWHMGRRERVRGKNWRLDRLIFPGTGILLCFFIHYIADAQINITGHVLNYLTMGLGICFSIFSSLAIIIAGNILTNGIISSAKIKEEALNADVIRLVCRLITFGLVFMLIYNLGLYYGIPVTAIFASAGIAGVAVALAAKETLANFFGGISIFMDRPFRAGDFIVLSTGERGEVQAVGMRSTRLVTRDNVMITIPNSLITDEKVVNQSMPLPFFRVGIKVGVAYGTDIDKVEAILLELAAANELVVSHPEPKFRFRGFGDSSLDVELLCWAARPHDQSQLVHQLNKSIYLRFNQEGIEIPFPQRDVHLQTSEA